MCSNFTGAVGRRDEIEIIGADQFVAGFAEETAVSGVDFAQGAIGSSEAGHFGMSVQELLALFIFSRDFVGCCLQGQFEILERVWGCAAIVGRRKSEFAPRQVGYALQA